MKENGQKIFEVDVWLEGEEEKKLVKSGYFYLEPIKIFSPQNEKKKEKKKPKQKMLMT